MLPGSRPRLQIRLVVEGELQQSVRAVNIELPEDVVAVIPPSIRVGISLQAGRRAGSVLIWILGFLERE